MVYEGQYGVWEYKGVEGLILCVIISYCGSVRDRGTRCVCMCDSVRVHVRNRKNRTLFYAKSLCKYYMYVPI